MKLKVESLATALRGIESDRELSQDIVEEALTEALTKAYRKYIDVPDAYVRVEIKNGNVQIWHERLVVDSPEEKASTNTSLPASKIGARKSTYSCIFTAEVVGISPSRISR